MDLLEMYQRREQQSEQQFSSLIKTKRKLIENEINRNEEKQEAFDNE